MMAGELSRPDGDFRRKSYEALLREHRAGGIPRVDGLAGELLAASAHDVLREGAEKIRKAGELHMLQLIRRFDGEMGTRLAWMHTASATRSTTAARSRSARGSAGRTPALTKRISGELTPSGRYDGRTLPAEARGAPSTAFRSRCCAAVAAAAPAQTASSAGSTSRRPATPAAQERFLRGVLLLHSFEYDDAAEEFRAAQKAEPGLRDGVLGRGDDEEPPALDGPRRGGRPQDPRAARRRRREARLAKAPTEREKGYLERRRDALRATGEKAERDRAYAEAMRRLHEEFPDDLEAQSVLRARAPRARARTTATSPST